jgi:hypothetical protein
MPHTSRQSYKDKAEAASRQAKALETALTVVEALSQELREREERENELLDVVARLGKSVRTLSGTLYGTVGDFGLGTLFDRSVDERLTECRPALVIARASVIMMAATERLEQLHLEHEDTEATSEALISQIATLSQAVSESCDRRRRLLIAGCGMTTEDRAQILGLDDEYTFDAAGPTLTEVYDIDKRDNDDLDGGHDSDDETVRRILNGNISEVARHDAARKLYEKRKGRIFR